MKRVVNCILRENNKILMLQKPKRGWWVVPGGKIESEETLQEAIIREYHEETDLLLENPTLKGVFTIIIKEADTIIDEWMLFTYYAEKYAGKLTSFCSEGILEWKYINEVYDLPKAQGDNMYLKEIIQNKKLITGKFYYTPKYELISYTIDHQLEFATKS